MGEPTPDQIKEMKKVALVIDGQVVDIIYSDDRFSAILLSNPVAVDITDRVPNEDIQVGHSYNADSNTFSE